MTSPLVPKLDLALKWKKPPSVIVRRAVKALDIFAELVSMHAVLLLQGSIGSSHKMFATAAVQEKS